MESLHDALRLAHQRRVAIGHFNISDLVSLEAIVEAAGDLRVPVLVGVSEGERDFIGVRAAAALVRSSREQTGRAIFLNADHTHTIARAEEAAREGFDEIIFDASSMPLEENIRETKKAVTAIKSIDPSIVVEGEIGYIGTSSEIHERMPEGLGALTTPKEAKQFVDATGIDVLAPAVGNMHGMLQSMVKGEVRKRLDIERIEAIRDATGIYMTLHGGSGTDDEDFQRAIRAGMTIVHINTELRIAWRRGIEQALANHPHEIAPYKILPEAIAQVKQVVVSRLRLFDFRT